MEAAISVHIRTLFLGWCLLLCLSFNASAAQLSDIPSSALPVVLNAISDDLPDYHVQTRVTQSGDQHHWAHISEQGMRASFASDGIVIESQTDQPLNDELAWNLQLKLTGYGYRDAVQPVSSKGDAIIKDSRIEYRYRNLSEWYINSPLGLEQGFTLNQPPAGSDKQQPLILQLSTRGDLHAELAGDGREIIFSDHQGEQIIRYSGLFAVDANGRELNATMNVHPGNILALEVNAGDAAWPITVDPLFSVLRYYNASDAESGDNFGVSVAVDGDWMAVGAQLADDGVTSNTGAVYLFQRVNSIWTEYVAEDLESILKGNAEAGAVFGFDVALQAKGFAGNPVLVVGAMGENGSGSAMGAAYVYEFGLFCADVDLGDYECWDEKARLVGSGVDNADFFGYSVAIDDEHIVIGSWLDEGPSPAPLDTGAVYTFQCSGIATNPAPFDQECGAWLETGHLYPSADSYFGYDVAIDEDLIAVGMPRESSLGQYNGAVFMYRWMQTGTSSIPPFLPIFEWVLEQKITEGAAPLDQLGISVAVAGNTVVAGAPRAVDPVTTNTSGVAQIYNWSQASGWNLGATLIPLADDNTTPEGITDDYFGVSVDILGSVYQGGNRRILVGAHRRHVATVSDAGSAYLYEYQGGDWPQINKFDNPAPGVNDYFGKAIALGNGMLVVGAYLDDYPASNAGSIYTYTSPNVSTVELELSSRSVLASNSSVISATATLNVSNIQPGPELSGRNLFLEIRDSADTLVESFSALTDNNGVATFADININNVLTTAGLYSVTARVGIRYEIFPPSTYLPLWNESTSPAQIVSAQLNAGYAVIIEGSVTAPGSSAELSTNKNAAHLRQSLIARGFTNNNIYYLGQDNARPGVDDLATMANLNHWLMSNVPGDGFKSLLERATDDPAPIHFFLVGHANNGGYFFLNPTGGSSNNGEVLLASQLDSWLDIIEAVPGISNWPRSVVIATPYSGGFIPALSDVSNAPGRVVVSSTGAFAGAFTGPEEQDGIAAGSYFLSELVEEWGRGQDLEASFRVAAERTRTQSRADDTVFSQANQYRDNALQIPLLDDDGDGVGTWREHGTDGDVAADVFLGVGQLEVIDPFFIYETQHLAVTGPFDLAIADIGQTHGQWTAAVRPASTAVTTPTGSMPTNLPYQRLDLVFQGTQKFGEFSIDYYGVTYDFTQSGRYEIWFWGEDNGKDTVSKRLVVMVDEPGNNAPAAFTLERPSPDDERISVATRPSVFEWGQAIDPDGDAVWYEVVVSASPTVDVDGRLTQQDFISGEINDSQWVVDQEITLAANTRYYWQVSAFDRFGQLADSAVVDFIPRPPDIAVPIVNPGFYGLVYEDSPVSGKLGLAGAVISWNGAPIEFEDIHGATQQLKSGNSGTYFLHAGFLPPSTITCGEDNNFQESTGTVDATLADYQNASTASQAYCSDAQLDDQDIIMEVSVDTDGDGVSDSIDNCIDDANASQTNTGGSILGDACDPDIDGDGVLNENDAFDYDLSASIDTDTDGMPDNFHTGFDAATSPTGLVEDLDDDNDLLSDIDEIIWGTEPLSPDSDGDGISDGDEVNVYGTNPASSNRGDLAPRGALDDIINAGDFVVLSRLVMGLETATATEVLLGDLNYSGGLDAGDLVLMGRVVTGQIPVP